MNDQLTLKSGRAFRLGLAPFAVGMKLFKTIANELKAVDVDLPNLDVRSIADADVNGIKNAIFQLVGSDAVEACVFECFARCTIDGEKVTRNSFDQADARGDYLPCAWEVIKHNLAPFFSGLDLSSLIQKRPSESDQKSVASLTTPP